MRRYPLEPLADAVGMTVAALGREVGMSGATRTKVETFGLTEAAADRYAVRLGLHPWEVWQDWFEGVDWKEEDVEPPRQEEDDTKNKDDGEITGYDIDHKTPLFDLTAVDEFWHRAVDLQAVLAAVDARLAAANAVVERRQLHGLSAQEVAILVERERHDAPDRSQGTRGGVAA